MKTHLVIKILEARAIQKGLIENNVIQHRELEEKNQRNAKPVIKAIEDTGNKNIAAIAKVIEQNKQHFQALPHRTQSLTHNQKYPWLQSLYRNFRHPTKCKSTQLEVTP